jgi:hypothetical protein
VGVDRDVGHGVLAAIGEVWMLSYASTVQCSGGGRDVGGVVIGHCDRYAVLSAFLTK